MHARYDRMTETARDELSVDGERGDERESERQGQTAPEQNIGEPGVSSR